MSDMETIKMADVGDPDELLGFEKDTYFALPDDQVGDLIRVLIEACKNLKAEAGKACPHYHGDASLERLTSWVMYTAASRVLADVLSNLSWGDSEDLDHPASLHRLHEYIEDSFCVIPSECADVWREHKKQLKDRRRLAVEERVGW